LFGQHDIQWIEPGREGEGDLIVFNNGGGQNYGYSSVDVLRLPGANGTYPLLSNNTWGPQQPNWSWNQGIEMYAQIVSGAERLPNGNTLVTDGTTGTLYEVDLNGEIVWKYVSPISNQGTMTQGEEIPAGNVSVALGNALFKARRYAPDFSAFSDKNMTPGSYIEHSTDSCPSEDAHPWDRDGDGCVDDSDDDGTNDPFDVCQGHDDKIDLDNDSLPDGCDDYVDSDGDGIVDENDACQGFDDSVDIDNDSIADGCDDLLDNDSDGISNIEDVCEGSDDSMDADSDGIPDGCDATPNGDEILSNHSDNSTNQSSEHSTSEENNSTNPQTDEPQTQDIDSKSTNTNAFVVKVAIGVGVFSIALAGLYFRISPPNSKDEGRS
jgi:hypothetical protein